METVFNPIGINRIFEGRIRIVARILDTVTRSNSTHTMRARENYLRLFEMLQTYLLKSKSAHSYRHR